MIKKIAWIGLIFIMASCAGGKRSTAQAIESTNTASPTRLTITPVTVMEMPTRTAVVLPTRTVTPEATQTATGNIPFDQVQPSPDDSKMTQGKVFLDKIDFHMGTLSILGSLPTPCHKLRVVLSDPTYANFTINLSVYSLRDNSLICIQSLAPFQLSIPINNILDGTYTVKVNDVSQFKFTWPEK
jgi:hypothetical protein